MRIIYILCYQGISGNIIRQWYNRQTIKISIKTQGMSKCIFPHDNYSIILDAPIINPANNSLRLIETNNNIANSSLLSFSCLDKRTSQLEGLEGEDSLGMSIMDKVEVKVVEDSLSNARSKKIGCTCKKTGCIKMYCQCFSVGKMCTPECSCFACYNHKEHEVFLEKTKHIKTTAAKSNSQRRKGCNCKKTNCQKKYCECYNAGLGCSSHCNCSDCYNKSLSLSKQQQFSPIQT